MRHLLPVNGMLLPISQNVDKLLVKALKECVPVRLLKWFFDERLFQETMRPIDYPSNEPTPKRILLTGGTGGIGIFSSSCEYYLSFSGLETVQQLCLLGHEVTFSGRSREKAEAARQIILRRNPNARVDYVVMDLEDFTQIQRGFSWLMLQKKKPYEILIMNAGVMLDPNGSTKDKLDSAFQVNYLAHFLLARLVIESKQPTDKLHIVCLASTLIGVDFKFLWSTPKTEDGYLKIVDAPNKKTHNCGWGEYRASKLLIAGLAQVFNGTKAITAVAVNPGNVRTDMARYMPWRAKLGLAVFACTLISTERAAKNVVQAALHTVDKEDRLWFDQSELVAQPETVHRAQFDQWLDRWSRELLLKRFHVVVPPTI
ncbi:unnamed protein product, partial [Mesorhabditis spiculigera]